MSPRLFTADFWFYELFVAVVITLLMASGIYRLRAQAGRRAIALSFCLLAYTVSVAMAVGHEWMRDSATASVKTLKNPTRPAHLSANWGSEFTKEDRVKYSVMLARITFEQWGEIVNHFDSEGRLQPYMPAPADHYGRARYLESIDVLEGEIATLLRVALAWLAVPLLGVGLGFMPLAAWLFRPKLKVDHGS